MLFLRHKGKPVYCIRIPSLMLTETRETATRLARAMLDRKLTDRTSGNLSNFGRATAPSGLPYANVAADDIPLLDSNGDVAWGRHSPSSEYRIHLRAYQICEDVKLVLHTLSRYCVAMACFR